MKPLFAVFLFVAGLLGFGSKAPPASPTADPQSARVDVDVRPVAGSSSNINGVLEPGETVQISPFWTNPNASPLAFTGTASALTGPPGPSYVINDGAADYATVGAGATVDCNGATGDCYLITVSGSRPAPHWDVTLTETLSAAPAGTDWIVHVGNSFPDVPTSNAFYFYVENIFHLGITGGCGGGNYCPGNTVTRAQMAVFLLKASLGSFYVPPACTGTVFLDVPCTGGLFDPWIEDLAGRGITGGCGGGNYCPGNPVTRAQMSVFLLRASQAPPTSRRPAPARSSWTCPARAASSIPGSRTWRHAASREAAEAATTAPAIPTPAARWPCSSRKCSRPPRIPPLPRPRRRRHL